MIVCVGSNASLHGAEPDRAELYRRLAATLTNTKFIGHFTVTGKELDKPAVEEYTILSATKLDQGEMWLLTARVKYGQHDVTLPIPLVIEWAGTTPVITLDKVTLPGLGTFSSRVVIHDGKYAGTWQHDEHGGHLFGKIEKLPEPATGTTPVPTAPPAEKGPGSTPAPAAKPSAR
jgi:hypothetical protein